MIGVIDYGLGNLFSLGNALDYIGAKWRFVQSPAELSECNGLILPGVGAFPQGMEALSSLGFVQSLRSWQKPLMGICLGMQLLFTESEEFSLTQGLGLIPGRVVKLTDVPKIPHMGWNTLSLNKAHPLLQGIDAGDAVYFVHSFHAITDNGNLLATCSYGGSVTAAVACGNVMGTQFHPEKSGEVGLTMLRNFVRITKEGL
ncbi:MAG: imidazole glycerol phosphate synthase subunit HisH [Clostridia bacterium]|nr:imidazole glycerol phosphate synthase subunit HisH [Clostridia bacterium]